MRVAAKSSLIAAAVIGCGLVSPAANANADTTGFLDFLARHGEDISTAQLREAQINYGLAICNLYSTSQSGDRVARYMMSLGDTPQQVAMWTVGSVMYLCPQYDYLLSG